ATEIVLGIDRAKASAAGVSPATVGEILRTAVFGTTATTITESGSDIDIVVRLALHGTEADPSAIPEVTLDALRTLTVPTVQGGGVLLGSIMSEHLAPVTASIAHEDGDRVATVSSYVDGTTALEVVNAFRLREAELGMPDGITASYGGESEDINKSF